MWKVSVGNLTSTVAIQLDFETFDLEESDTCLYDSLAILGDLEGTEEIGRSEDKILPLWDIFWFWGQF